MEALAISSGVLAALAAAHGAGVIHRDIKPENIMVRPDGLIKVLDFGPRQTGSRLVYAGVDFLFDPVRSDPRFPAFLRRLGLPTDLRYQSDWGRRQALEESGVRSQ